MLRVIKQFVLRVKQPFMPKRMQREMVRAMQGAMVRAMLKGMTFLLAVMILIIAMPGVAYAANETKDLFTLEESYHMAVSILFDKEMPDVSFTAPDGAVIEGASLRYESGDDWVQYYIPNAAVGSWKITYDKKSNTEFEINYSSYMEPVIISSFVVDTNSDNIENESNVDKNNDRIPVQFIVDGENTAGYQWQIYAVVTENNSVVGETMLDEGSASFGETVDREVYVGDLADYADYRLRLDVWQRVGVEEAFDSRVSDVVFAISGHTSGDAIEDFTVEINITEGELLIDWNEWAHGGDYLVAVFDLAQSSAEPIYYTEVTDSSNQAEALFDPATETIRIDLTGRRGSQNMPVRSKTIAIDNGVVINPVIGELTNSNQAKIEYTVPRSITAEVIVNGSSEMVNLNATGSFSLNLPETYNEAELRYSLDDENVVYIEAFQVIVDNIPPVLRLPENKTALRVDLDEYVLAGVTEAGTVLYVDDVAVAVNDDGTFIHTASLTDGENILNVTAADRAGNITAQNVVINRVNGGDDWSDENGVGWLQFVRRFLPFIISLVSSLILLLTILFLSRGYGRTADKKLYVLRTVRNIAVPVGISGFIAGGYFLWKYLTLSRLSKSEEYFALAQQSLDEAYEVLQDAAFALQMLKILGIVMGSCLLLAVLSNLLIQYRKRRTKEAPSPDEANRGSEEPLPVEAKADEIQTEAEEAPIVSEGQGDESIEAVPQDPTKYVCPSCGAKYDKPVKFCGKCGAVIQNS